MLKSYLLEILKQLSIDSLLMIVDLYFIGFICIYLIIGIIFSFLNQRRNLVYLKILYIILIIGVIIELLCLITL